jgi:hypothetical protein
MPPVQQHRCPALDVRSLQALFTTAEQWRQQLPDVATAAVCATRYFLRNAAETQVSEVELFLNSVPILNPLSQEEKLQLVDAFEEKTYKPGEQV